MFGGALGFGGVFGDDEGKEEVCQDAGEKAGKGGDENVEGAEDDGINADHFGKATNDAEDGAVSFGAIEAFVLDLVTHLFPFWSG